MRNIAAILLSALAAAVLVSCDRGSIDKDVFGQYIQISANMGSKAMIESADAFKAFTLYGQTLVETQGEPDPASASGEPTTVTTVETIIAGKETSFADSKWSIAATGSNEGKYPWERGKDYAFFGWLTKDSSGDASDTFFGSDLKFTPPAKENENDPDKVGGTLTVPAKALELSADHFDFCYTDVEYRSSARANYSEVALSFKHLFAAFGFSAHNYTTEPVSIISLILYNIKDEKGATISFSRDGSSATYGSGESWSTGNLIPSGGITLNAEESAADIIGAKSTTAKYYMVWPQTALELAPSDPVGTSGAYVEVKYSQNGGATQTKKLAVPIDEGIGWPAGSRRKMELSFGPRSLTLTATPLPWNKTDASIDYTGLVSVGQTLAFDNTTCIIDDVNKKIYFKGDFPIKASFKVDQPLNGSWLISKSGDFDAFEVDNTTMDIGTGESGDGIDSLEGLIDPSELAYISICPKIASPERDYTMQLVFSVRNSSGLVSDINDKVQPVVYTIVLLKK